MSYATFVVVGQRYIVVPRLDRDLGWRSRYGGKTVTVVDYGSSLAKIRTDDGDEVWCDKIELESVHA